MASKKIKEEDKKTKQKVKKDVVEKDKTNIKKNITKAKTGTTKKNNTKSKTIINENKNDSVKLEKKVDTEVKKEVESKVIDDKKNKKELEKALKNERKKIDSVGMIDSDISGKIIMICIVICVFCAFYFLTVFISKDNNNSSSNSSNSSSISSSSSSSSNSSNSSSTSSSSSSSSNASISYDNIIIGRSFSMDDDAYLVLYYDGSNSDLSSTVGTLVSTYKNKDSYLPIYKVDMSDGLNKNYTSEESNTNPRSVEDLHINGITLIKFVDNKVDEYIEGQDSISDYLG